MNTNTSPFGPVIHAYTAADAERDGMLVRPQPTLATEAGFRIPFLMTQAARDETVTWTRESGWQDETGRFWDVLTMARYAISRGAGFDRPLTFRVARIPNLTPSGKHSTATTPTTVELRLALEGYDLDGAPCIIVALPHED